MINKISTISILLIFIFYSFFCVSTINSRQEKSNKWVTEYIAKTDTTICELKECRTKMDIWTTVEPATFKLKTIYETLFPRRKRPRGIITIKFYITPEGIVDTCFITKDEINNTIFNNRILNVIDGLQFIETQKGDSAVYPFVFSED